MVKLSSIIENPISGEWGLEDLNKTGLPVLRITNFTNEGIINYNNITTRIFLKKNIKVFLLNKMIISLKVMILMI